MHQYLKDTEFASRQLVELIAYEEIEKQNLYYYANELARKADFFYNDAATADIQEDFDEAYVMNRFGIASNAHKQSVQKLEEIAQLQSAIDHKQKSLETLSGALLQLAKQGISIAYPGSPAHSLGSCPDGRSLYSQPIKTIIWEARNQAMHYDDPNPYRKNVVNCFAVLAVDHGSDFTLVKNENFARKVVFLLAWTDWQSFIADMDSLI